jgi:hypothetical protein
MDLVVKANSFTSVRRFDDGVVVRDRMRDHSLEGLAHTGTIVSNEEDHGGRSTSAEKRRA